MSRCSLRRIYLSCPSITEGENTPAPAVQGVVAVPNLPQDTKEQIQSLYAGLWECQSVGRVFKKGNCVPEMKALMHSSEDAMDKLTMTDCPTQQLIDQVAVVYGDFHTALTRCVERGFGKEVAKGIFVISNQGDLWAIDALYGKSPACVNLMVLTSVKTVHHAAKAALSK